MKNFHMYVFLVIIGLVGAPFSQSFADDSIKGAYKASELVGKSKTCTLDSRFIVSGCCHCVAGSDCAST
jgi:hypothetical protein